MLCGRVSRFFGSAWSAAGTASQHGDGSAARSKADANRLRASERVEGWLTPGQQRAAVILISAVVVVAVARLMLNGGFSDRTQLEPPPLANVAAMQPEPEVVAPAPRPGRIAVRGNMAGAHLEIVDADRGTLAHEGLANGESIELVAGRYAMRVEHVDCRDIWSRDLELEAGTHHEILARNCRDQGWLIVRSNLAQDRLRIDGEPLGVTGPNQHPVATGEHHIEISKPGYLPWAGAVEVPAGTTVSVRASLQPKPPDAVTQSAQPGQSGFGSESGNGMGAQGPSPQDALTPLERERTHEWHRSAKRYLLSRYDIDSSGRLDTRNEVLEIPCDDWRSFEASFDQGGLRLPLSRFYGFDGTKWVENAFGISADMRAVAYDHMLECGMR